jgi:hypothetical protein
MIGEEEAALWRQAEESAGALDSISPLLHIVLDFAKSDASIESVFASPVMAKIRALSFNAMVREEENYQSNPYWYFGDTVVRTLCSSPNVTQLEGLPRRPHFARCRR